MGFRRFYGAGPLHLPLLLASFAVAAFAVLQASDGPAPIKMALWFVGALIAHDLVLFPLYALADRGLTSAARGQVRLSTVNYVRVPALLSGLLLLLFWPVITQHSERTYMIASGLTENPYLERWLLITAALFIASALIWAVRAGTSRR